MRYFSQPLVFKYIYFLETKSLLPFLTFVNYEGRYFAAGFFHKLCPYVDIVFAQLGVIPRRNKFFEIVAVAKCHVIANYVESKESKKQTFRICLTI